MAASYRSTDSQDYDNPEPTVRPLSVVPADNLPVGRRSRANTHDGKGQARAVGRMLEERHRSRGVDLNAWQEEPSGSGICFALRFPDGTAVKVSGYPEHDRYTLAIGELRTESRQLPGGQPDITVFEIFDSVSGGERSVAGGLATAISTRFAERRRAQLHATTPVATKISAQQAAENRARIVAGAEQILRTAREVLGS